jgi:c-di-GMP-binding flagellar brake protein YcgR
LTTECGSGDEIRSISSGWDDDEGMAGFLGRLIERIGAREVVDPAVRTAFDQAMEIEGRITLIRPDPETGSMLFHKVGMESLDDSSFLVVAQDELPMQPGDVFEVAVLGRAGRQCGMIKFLGNERVPSGGRMPMTGYRFAYPPTMDHNERRRAHRVSVGFDLAPLARIFDGRTSGPVEAAIMDLSIGGMQLKCDAHPDRFAPGQSIDLDVQLPDPVGRLLVPARVASVRHDESGLDRIGISFVQAVEGMAQLVRSIEVRRASRRRGDRSGSRIGGGATHGPG